MSHTKKCEIHGTVAPGFESVRQLYEHNMNTMAEENTQLCIYYRGERVVDLWASATNDTSFSWQKDYEIGVDEIDLEHKSIIDNYEKLYHYMITGKGHDYYDEMVQFLEKYVNEHFVHEELFQKSINYDQMAEHAEHHRLFKEKVFGIIANQKEKEVTNMDLVRINLFLKDWLLHHILVEDAKIGIFLGKKANH